MNRTLELLKSTYKPELMLVVYRTETEQKLYLESHAINSEGKVMEGKPLLQETINSIVDVFFDDRKSRSTITGLMPENLLSFEVAYGGGYRMVWYRPAEIRVVHFADQLKIPTDKAWVPPMIYEVYDDELRVYSFKGNQRPTEKTPLYLAPFFNIDDHGNVCLGNADVKIPEEKTYESLIKYWEDLFWLSKFTHLNGEVKTRTDLSKVWKKLIASKTKMKWSDIDEMLLYKDFRLKNIIK